MSSIFFAGTPEISTTPTIPSLETMSLSSVTRSGFHDATLGIKQSPRPCKRGHGCLDVAGPDISRASLKLAHHSVPDCHGVHREIVKALLSGT